MENIRIENTLNKILTKLDNFDLEYKKLFDIGKSELNKLLEQKEDEIYAKIQERLKGIKPYKLHLEGIKGLNFEEKKDYVNGYNQALQDIDNRIDNFINLNFEFIIKYKKV